MSDLKLISPDQPTPFEQRLLDAVSNESPSAEQRARVRRALGLSAVALPTAPASPVGRRALLLKAGGGLVVVSGVALGLFFGAGHDPGAGKLAAPAIVTQQSARALAVTEPAVPVAPVASEATPIAVPSAEPTSSTGGPDAKAHEENAPLKRTSKPAAADSATDLSEQLRLIDAARSAVAAGNALAASAALSTYRTRFPRGPFAQEAAVLQIETLDLQGNHALAAAQARSFLARYPNSPHVSVVRRIAER
ncbi:MAG TPA: outer membrane protein assembly factor BamD [Polyangiaceae bacterium]|nr:outer membrane protein assembly factor BamD [Polyangiaceae bacterium]